MTKLYATISLPRAGKSTLAKKWLNYENYIEDYRFKEFKVNNNGEILGTRMEYVSWIWKERRVVVSGDSIRRSLYGELWNPDCETIVDSIKWTMIKTLLDNGHTVLLDETNTSKRSIEKILEIDINAEFAFIDTTREDCKTRANRNSLSLNIESNLIKPINRMYNNLMNLGHSYAFSDVWDTPDWLDFHDIELIIRGIKEDLIEFKKKYTNEPIRITAANSELSEVPTTLNNTKPPQSVTWNHTKSTDKQEWAVY